MKSSGRVKAHDEIEGLHVKAAQEFVKRVHYEVRVYFLDSTSERNQNMLIKYVGETEIC